MARIAPAWDRDVEELGALPQPALGDQQMSGARYRQEFRDSLDDPQMAVLRVSGTKVFRWRSWPLS